MCKNLYVFGQSDKSISAKRKVTSLTQAVENTVETQTWRHAISFTKHNSRSVKQSFIIFNTSTACDFLLNCFVQKKFLFTCGLFDESCSLWNQNTVLYLIKEIFILFVNPWESLSENYMSYVKKSQLFKKKYKLENRSGGRPSKTNF